jgi:hypothetical protein
MSSKEVYLIEFLPGIWISNTKIFSEKFLKQKKINEIIDCNKSMNFFEGSENYIESIKNEIKKTNHVKLHKYLVDTTQHIHQNIINGNSMLIYDQHSIKKAPVLLISYLMRYGHLTPAQTIQSYQSKSKLPLQLSQDYQYALKIFYSKINTN